MQPQPQPSLPRSRPQESRECERPAYTLVNTPQDLTRVLLWLQTAGESITLDCEATGKDPVAATPLLLQLGNWRGEAFVLDLTRLSACTLTPLWLCLAEHILVGHNLNYDYRLLKSHYPAVRFPRVYDTQLAEQVLTCGQYDHKGSWLTQLSLRALAEKYLGVTLDKSVRESFTESGKSFEPTQEQLAYAAEDVLVLPAIVDKQMQLLKGQGMWLAAQLRFGALVPLAEVELRGMLIDQTSWRAFLSELREQRIAVETELRVLLQPNETEYRLVKYERELRAYETWEAMQAEYLADIKQEYARTGGWNAAGTEKMAWGKYKIELMRQWREEHPNPGKPKLDTTPINLDSDVQVKRAYHLLGLRVEKTNKETRENLLLSKSLSDEQLRLVQLHAQQSILSHNEGSFGENVLSRIVPQTGRLHTHFNIGLTETGRMSSEKPSFQNMPSNPKLRHSFIADPGTYVVTADFSGQELAIAAALSGCTQMKEDLAAGRDLYKELAVMVWGGTVEQVTKEQRKKAKNGLLGINYGLSAKGLANRNHIPLHEATAILNAIKDRYHELVAWGDQQVFFAKANGFVQTADGARRFFPDAATMGWKIATETRNAPIQGTAAGIIYRCAARMDQRCVPIGIRPVNFVHDEVVSLVDAHIPEERALALIEREMTGAFYDLLPYDRYGVKVSVDLHAGPYWTKE